MSQYAFEIWDDNGNMLADLTGKAHNRSFTVSRNLPEQISFTVELNEIEELARTINVPIRDLINPGKNEVRIRGLTGYLVGGRIQLADVILNGDQKHLSIRADGFLNLFEDRYAGETTPRVFTATDAGTIAKTLIDEAQAETNGNMGVQTNVAWIETTTARDLNLDRRKIKDVILSLASLAGGFDFEFTYDKKFRVYGSIGEDRTDLVFSYPGNIRNFRLPIDATKVTNRVIVRGAGFGESQYTVTEEDLVSQETYKRRVRIVEEPTETSLTNLSAKADETIRIFALPLEIPEITLDGRLAPRVGSDFWIGDSIKVVTEGVAILEQLNSTWRVEEIRVDIDDDDVEVISLKLAK